MLFAAEQMVKSKVTEVVRIICDKPASVAHEATVLAWPARFVRAY